METGGYSRGQAMLHDAGVAVTSDIGYPTPGSFGTYIEKMGIQHGDPGDAQYRCRNLLAAEPRCAVGGDSSGSKRIGGFNYLGSA